MTFHNPPTAILGAGFSSQRDVPAPPPTISGLQAGWRDLRGRMRPGRPISHAEIAALLDEEARLVGALAVAPARTIAEAKAKLSAISDLIETDDPDMRLVSILLVAARADLDLVAARARDG